MNHVIQHFMWGYQPHFRIHIELIAESVLKKLDERFQPEVFLVGILREEKQNRYPACVEPETESWIESEEFNNVLELAASFRTDYVEAQLFHSHPIAQQREDEALFRRSIRDAILDIITHHIAKPQNVIFFASLPEMVNGYLVSVVFSIQEDVFNSHYQLYSDVINIHEYRQVHVSRSLIDAAISELLINATEGLLKPDPGLGIGNREADEIIRAAGRRLAWETAFRVDPDAIEGIYDFFNSCNKISSLKYEQADGRGKLVLAREDHKSIQTWIAFDDNIKLNDYRRSRKLLELVSHGSALHINSHRIFGLVDENVNLDDGEDVEDLFEVRFLGHHHWELSYKGHVLMGVKFGEPYLPKIIGYESKLLQDLPRLFPEITNNTCNILVSLVQQAEKERHGTLLLISSEAALESKRLRNQATPIKITLLTPELLSHLTGIDGAVLIDPNGHCHAIGVILDGLATSQGNPSRGARFNSAVRYVESAFERGISSLAVIVSEDGGVDFFPNLRPRIKRLLIDRALDELASISKELNISFRRYNRLYDWLRLHRFYLLQEDCNKINLLIQEIERRLVEADPTGIRIIRETFLSHPDMEPSFYYESE
jgi:hypothetical protein